MIWNSSNCNLKTLPVCLLSVLIQSWLAGILGSSAALRSQILILPLNYFYHQMITMIRCRLHTVICTRDYTFIVKSNTSDEFFMAFQTSQAGTMLNIPNFYCIVRRAGHNNVSSVLQASWIFWKVRTKIML